MAGTEKPRAAKRPRRAARRRRRRRKPAPIPASYILKPVDGESVQSWLEPRSGDLLRDVMYLQEQVAGQDNDLLRSVHARAAVVMATATIEAATNDAIATIYALMTGTPSAEEMRKPPWIHFRGRSTDRMAALFRRGAYHRKREYVLAQIERCTGAGLPGGLASEIDTLTKFRNRIVHSNFATRSRASEPPNAQECAQVVERACNAARAWLDFLSQQFIDMKLPIQAIRTRPHAGGDLDRVGDEPPMRLSGET